MTKRLDLLKQADGILESQPGFTNWRANRGRSAYQRNWRAEQSVKRAVAIIAAADRQTVRHLNREFRERRLAGDPECQGIDYRVWVAAQLTMRQTPEGPD